MAQDATAEMVDTLSELGLFTGLGRPELEKLAHTFEEEWNPAVSGSSARGSPVRAST